MNGYTESTNDSGSVLGGHDVVFDQINLAPNKKPKIKKRNILIAGCFIVVVIALLVVIVVAINLNKSSGVDDWDIAEQEKINDMISDSLDLPNEDIEDYLSQQMSKYDGTDLEFSAKLAEINILSSRGMVEQALLKSENINVDTLNKYELMNYYSAMQSLYYNAGDDEKSIEYQNLYMKVYFEIYGDEEVGG